MPTDQSGNNPPGKSIPAQLAPYPVDVEAGKAYAWCACGRSKNQPMCDGSHKGTGISPVIYKSEKAETVYFCGCKATKTQPMCDGTHSTLPA
jgi:CDGSH-type Zn-finger protein